MIMVDGTVALTDLILKPPIEPITSGCKNCVFLRLHFSKCWREYTERTVEFCTASGERYRAAVARDGTCVFPEGTLLRCGTVYLSVVGERYDADGEVAARAVTEMVPLYVFRGGYDGGEV